MLRDEEPHGDLPQGWKNLMSVARQAVSGGQAGFAGGVARGVLGMVETRIAKDPEGARLGLLGLVRVAVTELGITAAELYGEPEPPKP